MGEHLEATGSSERFSSDLLKKGRDGLDFFQFYKLADDESFKDSERATEHVKSSCGDWLVATGFVDPTDIYMAKKFTSFAKRSVSPSGSHALLGEVYYARSGENLQFKRKPKFTKHWGINSEGLSQSGPEGPEAWPWSQSAVVPAWIENIQSTSVQ